MQRSSIAVVGSGIAGLSCAWLLSKSHDVTVFEQEARLGGHSNTVDVQEAGGDVPVDTGFIVYNTASYPNLIALFEHLGVETAPTRMGFSVSLEGGDYEYSGTGAQGLFGQPLNVLRVAHWQMVRDILRFFREAEHLAADAVDETLSLGAWLDRHGYSTAFKQRHILPMAAAIWSSPADEALQYPVAAFARFFSNHGLLQVRNRPQWRTVRGGSKRYVEALARDMRGNRTLSAKVMAVSRDASGATVMLADSSRRRFDHVVLACHANDALALLTDATVDERRTLAPFRYQANRAVLHTDASLMPRRRRLWSSWNYIGGKTTRDLCVSYWMNGLQPLETTTDYFVTLNPPVAVAPDKVHAAFDYQHPLFDSAAIAAQRELWRLQGPRRTWFAGSYFGSGFHEDGLQSGLWVAEQLGGVKRPWTVAGENNRLTLGPEQSHAAVTEVAA